VVLWVFKINWNQWLFDSSFFKYLELVVCQDLKIVKTWNRWLLRKSNTWHTLLFTQFPLYWNYALQVTYRMNLLGFGPKTIGKLVTSQNYMDFLVSCSFLQDFIPRYHHSFQWLIYPMAFIPLGSIFQITCSQLPWAHEGKWCGSPSESMSY
jgi:hypothetical protein